jgi:hypothetical protein
MAWSNSKIFRAFVADVLDNTTAVDLGSDVPKVALYNNTTAPDQDVSSANSAFNAAQWTTANQVTDVTNWVSGGRALASTSLSSATAGVVFYDAADLAGGGTVTISGAYGCLVYDDTLTTPVADQGLCFNYFGGSQSVTAGTFTIVWSASGIFRFTL